MQIQKFTDKDRMIFYKQLAIILRSGLPILKGIKLLDQRVDKKLRVVCNELHNDLARGYSLTTSMSRQRHFFNDLGITLIRAGEESGRLEEIAIELANYYGKQYELKKYIVKAALYPLFLLFTTGCVFILFIFFVLPVLATTYSSMQIKPQGLLALALEIQVFVKTHIPLVFLMVSISIICSYKLKEKLLYLAKQIPFVGKLYYQVLEIRFCKLLALLLNSGIGIVSAVSISLNVIDDEKCRRKVLLFQERLQKGSDINSATLSLINWISPLSINLISIGAVTGYLPKMLSEAATISEQDLQNELDRLKEIITPILLLLTAFITASVISSIVGPLFNLISALPEHI